MKNLELKATITQNVTMEFHHKEIIIFYEKSEIKLLTIKSYREYLDFVNASKPTWSLQDQQEIYRWMRENGWL